MNMQPPKRKVPIKSNYQFLIRAKMYGVITLNSLEGMMRELNELIPIEMERDNIDTFSEELRRYQNVGLMPTSHGDYLDRAIKSLAKEIGIQIPVELGNSAVVKTLVSNIIIGSQGDERHQYLTWLEQPNELIAKSPRFDHLVNHACMCFYKKPMTSVSEDTINFIRRSIHDMIRSKSTKDHLHAQLLSTPSLVQPPMDAMINPYEYGDGTMYGTNHIEDGERIIHVDLMGGMRQPTERELEMVNHAAVQQRSSENIAL